MLQRITSDYACLLNFLSRFAHGIEALNGLGNAKQVYIFWEDEVGGSNPSKAPRCLVAQPVEREKPLATFVPILFW